jgi:lipopolysaccharide/colanic/teichoic acid biosynthesis glycosyltransferase
VYDEFAVVDIHDTIHLWPDGLIQSPTSSSLEAIMHKQPFIAGNAPCLDAGALRRALNMLRRELLCRCWSTVPGMQLHAKRLLDLTLTLLALIVFAPLMLLSALVIKCSDGGPVLFWQERVGKHARVFRFPKFRSMVVNAEQIQAQMDARNEHQGGITFKMARDPRITRFGRFLRRSSIDELPQLWCVLKGEMSLVGPRPGLCRELARYSLADRRRLDGIPGLTCHWQVQGRSELGFEQQVQLDVAYLDHQSLVLDLCLLARTVPAVLGGRGAY